MAEYIKVRSKQAADGRIAGIQRIKEVWTEIMEDREEKTTDRLKASELLAKTCGAFLDRPEADDGKLGELIGGLQEGDIQQETIGVDEAMAER